MNVFILAIVLIGSVGAAWLMGEFNGLSALAVIVAFVLMYAGIARSVTDDPHPESLSRLDELERSG